MINYLILVTVTIIWGASYVLIKDVTDIPIEVTQLLRYIAAIIFMILIADKEIRKISRGDFLRLFGYVGIPSFLASWLTVLGLQTETASQAAFLCNMPTILIPIILFLQYKKKITYIQSISLIICLVGLILITAPWSSTFGTGSIILLGAAIAYSYQFIYSNQQIKFVKVSQITFVQFLANIVGYGAICLFNHNLGRVTTISNVDWLKILILGTIITGMCWFFYVRIQATISVIMVILIVSLEPVMTIIVERLYLGISMNMIQSIGGLIMLAATLVCSLEKFILKKH